MPVRRSGCCWRSCGSSPTRTSSVDLYALAASEVYGLGGEDLTAIVNIARRRNRSVWAILEELEAQPGILRLRPETRATVHALVADLARYVALAHERPAGELLYGFLRRSGILARLAATDSVAAEEALSNIARFFEIVRAQSALLADDRAIFLAPHLQTLIEAGDDPATADLDPDARRGRGPDRPQGQGPRVPRRLPARARRRPVPRHRSWRAAGAPGGPRSGSRPEPGARARRGAPALLRRDDPGARRADPVARRRLRRGARPAGLAVRARGPRPAGDGGGARRRGRAAPAPLDRLAAFEAAAARPEAPRGPIEEPLSLSFYQVDDYLTCPLKYKYAHVLRVPLAPHHAIVYGAALHKAVQMFHQRHAPRARHERGGARRGLRVGLDERGVRQPRARGGPAGGRPPGAASVPGRPARARRRHPDLRRARVQLRARRRPGPRPLGPGRRRADRRGPSGRRRRRTREPAASADVVSPTLGILGPERVTITDYKSSDVRDPAKARQRARDSLQLQIYAMGYEAMTGRLPDAVALHFLESGLVGRVEVDPKRLAKAKAQDRDRGRRDAGPRLHAQAGLPRLHVLRVPRHLPVERRAIGPAHRASDPATATPP